MPGRSASRPRTSLATPFRSLPERRKRGHFQHRRRHRAVLHRLCETLRLPGRPDEITFWDWVLSPVKSESGKTEGLLLSLSNATDRKRGEEERLRAERDFRELFDAASDALFVLNLASQFIAVNETACSRLGYSRVELLGMGPAGIDSPNIARASRSACVNLCKPDTSFSSRSTAPETAIESRWRFRPAHRIFRSAGHSLHRP